ncbi:CBS domain-containing protein [Streptomyces sp. N2-109]|uniref:CBS domain-containing protein n=1 Tax=Streptomyces gossypii TaxID=2883101 RepID=A0ABT2JVF2_9ACTN|nr:CBS domain-containing protein [Streptomyces gossypii]MCT2591861.1 CBS domain-containing protein [Streptomyces gossypii]
MPTLVADAMSTLVLTIGPTHTLRQAAALMSARRVGAAVVLDPDDSGVGILTERDVLNAVGAGLDPDRETAQAHTTTDIVFASPEWTLSEAARAMAHGGFRHLIVLDQREPVGVMSVRDIVRCWSGIPDQHDERRGDRHGDRHAESSAGASAAQSD